MIRRFLRISPAPLMLSCVDYILLRPVVFSLWFHLRKWTLMAKRKLFRRNDALLREIVFEYGVGKEHIVGTVVPHNKKNMWGINRDRTERVINILRTIRVVNSRESKILCIGPRNEAEILLMSRYGFPIANIVSIDLFTYTPLIKVM